MAKKVLVILSVALFFILVSLLVFYFYLNRPTNKERSILIFIPSETEMVIRLNETSQSANKFLSTPEVHECLNLEEIRRYWMSIDSITSRNYKTAEILLKNSSYLCIDSSLNYLILVDLNKRTNEHFIDQFLANSTTLHKIERFKEGYKAFYTKQDAPMFYFVQQNVFAVSSNAMYLQQSVKNSVAETIVKEIGEWDARSNADLSIWGKTGTEIKIIAPLFKGHSIFGGWLDKFSSSFWFDISVENELILMNGELKYDSLNAQIPLFTESTSNDNILFFHQDTSAYVNKYLCFSIVDSLGQKQPVSFTYHLFRDSLQSPVELFVSKSPLAFLFFQKAIQDTTVQIIPMADENIQQIAAIDHKTSLAIAPVLPFQADTGKLFATMYNGVLFISSSTEGILNHAPGYPNSMLKRESINDKIFLLSKEQAYFRPFYMLECRFMWDRPGSILFEAEMGKSNRK